MIRRSDGTTETLYVTTDHLGSTESVLNAAGTVLARTSFAAWGARRGSNWQGVPSQPEWQAIADTTRRGYTGHEHLDNVMLVHMNGRVYDPAIGRFLSADPYVDGVVGSQGWNRYAYVHSNPITYTDPTGYSFVRGSSLNWKVAWVNRDRDVKQGNEASNGSGTTQELEEIIVNGTKLELNLQSTISPLDWKAMLRELSTSFGASGSGNTGGRGSSGDARRQNLPCSAASTTPQQDSDVLIQIGYTDIGSLPFVNHMFVLATDPVGGGTYASRSGPGLGPIGQDGVGPWNTAVSGPYSRGFPDFGAAHSVQSVGYISLPFSDVRGYMDAFASATNSPTNFYLILSGNSNSYASRLVEGLGLGRIEPSLPAPGSSGGRVLRNLRCEPK